MITSQEDWEKRQLSAKNCQDIQQAIEEFIGQERRGLGYLPGGHLPPPKFGHLPSPNSDIYHPKNGTFARRTTATPKIFFFFFWRTFLGFFDLQLIEDIKDGKEVAMEHIKKKVRDKVVMEHIK